MIYIHAENLGLLDHLVNTNFAETSAKNYSWSIRLSTRDNSSDKNTTVVEMPQEMALSLFWWYMEKEASDKLLYQISCLLDEMPKEHIVEQLEWSVTQLVSNRKRSYVYGRVITSTEADMASEIEDHIEDGHENELYALLDAKGFEKFVEVVA